MVQPPHEKLAEHRHFQREAHTQRLTLADALQPEQFDDTQFIAYVDHSSLKVDKLGTISISFRVPIEWRNRVLPLLNAPGVLLSVDVQRWKAVPSETDD